MVAGFDVAGPKSYRRLSRRVEAETLGVFSLRHPTARSTKPGNPVTI
jgi:hypothetical protein